MISPSAIRRAALAAGLALASSAALIVGISGPASAFTDDDVSGCLDFKYSKSKIRNWQKVVGTNTCRNGVYGFRVHNWSKISSETSPCLKAGPGRWTGWQWTKGRKNWEIISC